MKFSSIGNNTKGTLFNHNLPQSRQTHFLPQFIYTRTKKEHLSPPAPHTHSSYFFCFILFLEGFFNRYIFLFSQEYFQRQTQGILGDT